MSNILNRYFSINKESPMTPKTLEYRHLERILPQAYPFLLIDRVVDILEGESLTAIKNITANEWPCCCGRGSQHYPETLLIEAAAQAALVLYHVSKVKEGDPRPQYVLGRTKAEFRDFANIGEQISLGVTKIRLFSAMGYMGVAVRAENKEIADMELMFGIRGGE